MNAKVPKLTKADLNLMADTIDERISDLHAFHDNYRLCMTKEEAIKEIHALEDLAEKIRKMRA